MVTQDSEITNRHLLAQPPPSPFPTLAFNKEGLKEWPQSCAEWSAWEPQQNCVRN